MLTAGAIFDAIIGAIRAVPIIDGWFQQLIATWMMVQTQATLGKITDAAAFAAKAQTDADRYAASAKWQQALQQDKVST